MGCHNNNIQLFRKILLVSSDEITQSLHQGFLKQLSYLVDIVDAGEQATERLARKSYDAMLLELELPGITGEVVLTSIRLQAVLSQKHLPIIVTSTNERRLKACLEYGADNALLKPVSCEILSQTLAELDLTPVIAAD